MHYERAPRLQKAEAGAVRARRGLAPAPPGFSALVPLPMRDSRQNGKRDAVASPPRSVEATVSALRLLPSRALSSAQFALIISGPGIRRGWIMALYPGGRYTLARIIFPQGDNSDES